MLIKRRSFLGALAALPLVGRLFAASPNDEPYIPRWSYRKPKLIAVHRSSKGWGIGPQEPINFPAPVPSECEFTHVTIFTGKESITLPMKLPNLHISAGVTPSFASET